MKVLAIFTCFNRKEKQSNVLRPLPQEIWSAILPSLWQMTAVLMGRTSCLRICSYPILYMCCEGREIGSTRAGCM